MFNCSIIATKLTAISMQARTHKSKARNKPLGFFRRKPFTKFTSGHSMSLDFQAVGFNRAAHGYKHCIENYVTSAISLLQIITNESAKRRALECQNCDQEAVC